MSTNMILRLLGQKYAPKETEQHLKSEIEGALDRVMQIAECCRKSQSAHEAVDMSRVKAVVFDFGGVLIDWNPRYFFRSYFHDDERMEYSSLMCVTKNGTKSRMVDAASLRLWLRQRVYILSSPMP